MVTKVLLPKGNNLFIYLFVCLFVCSSCSRENKTELYVKNNIKNYEYLYKIANDSINLYLDSLLNDFLHIYEEEWQLDSMICINSTRNKMVGTINSSSGIGKNCSMDEVTKILGKKINGKWYFFEGGGTLVVPRDLYGKDEMHPLSMHELSQIARKEFLQGALIKNENGDYVVSDKWVNRHFEYNGMCAHCKTTAQYDSTHWQKITDKWKHKIDTAEYKKQKESVL